MKVWIIRHGESETNRDGRWTGWLDVPLTPKGEQDAAKASGLLRGVCFDRIYTSDLQRARKTAEIAIPGGCFETSEMLREIDLGTLAGQPLAVLDDAQRKAAFAEGYAAFSGESRAEFHARIAAFMQKLEALPLQNVAVFSHAGFLRGFLGLVLGVSLPSKKLQCQNCTVAIFECKGSEWGLHSWINLQ